MLKALAVLRTLALIFFIAFTVRAMPAFMQVARTFDEQYSRCASSLALTQRAAWYAIAWIAFDTAVGWLIATRRPRVLPPGEAPMPPGAPPFQPPPHA